MSMPLDRSCIDHSGHPFVAMPLGGLGTGNMAICSDGALRQWQLHNIGNHIGDLPLSLFALRVSCVEPPLDEVRVLQTKISEHPQTSLTNDDFIPEWQKDIVQARGVQSVSFRSIYPEAWLDFYDDDLPLEVSLNAFNPLSPLDTEDSSIPAALFSFQLTNRSPYAVFGWLGASLLNAVGWDGVTPFDGTKNPLMGGNTNRVARHNEWTSLILENHNLDEYHPGQGDMVVSCDQPNAPVLRQYSSEAELFRFLETRAMGVPIEQPSGSMFIPQPHGPAEVVGSSRSGSTWAGMVAPRFDLQPGQSVEIRFAITWSFPNRYVNFGQFGPERPEFGPTKFWLGNHYATKYPSAADALSDVVRRWDELHERTRLWTGCLADSSLDPVSVERFAAQPSYLRSPSVFQSADGRWLGFEGVLGASTRMWNADIGGSCPLNCTHVWNYVQAAAAIFPQIERDMRETEFQVMQHPSGYIPHRVVVPTYLPQLWDEPIGGPTDPALDGMLGAVLKTLREVQRGAGLDWLTKIWPRLCKLMEYIQEKWDNQGDGFLHGIQPSTHDIDLAGSNTFMGTLYLAALRASEELAKLMNDEEVAHKARIAFERSRDAYESLFNGEYFEQRLEPGDNPNYQWVTGCLSDQLIGQWWAHVLGLGYILDSEHVKTALKSIVKYNLRDDFTGFDHGYRVYAEGSEAGLLTCTWPLGERPGVPTRYADEVWTGVEYQVASHCAFEGLNDLSSRITDAVWARYDGRRRNPFNEIECGDHYVRAMAGWSILEARAGVIPTLDGDLRIREGLPGAWPIVHRNGFGLLHRLDGKYSFEDRRGRFTGKLILESEERS